MLIDTDFVYFKEAECVFMFRSLLLKHTDKLFYELY